MRSALADGEYTHVAEDQDHRRSRERKQPSLVGVGAAERERRIRLEATKRRRWDPAQHVKNSQSTRTAHSSLCRVDAKDCKASALVNSTHLSAR